MLLSTSSEVIQILTRRRIDGAVAVVYKNTGSAIYRSVTAIAELVVAVDSDVYML